MELSDLELLHQLQEICYVQIEDEYGGFDWKLDKHRLNLIYLVAEKFDQAKIEHDKLEGMKQKVKRYFEILSDEEYWRDIGLINELSSLERELKQIWESEEEKD